MSKGKVWYEYGGKRKGAGRPPTKEKSARIWTTVPAKMNLAIAEKAEKRGVTVSKYLRMLIEKDLEQS